MKFVGLLLFAIVPFLLYVLFVFIPVDLYTENQCLAKGYPNYAVSVMLNRYCMNLSGSVTVSVDELRAN